MHKGMLLRNKVKAINTTSCFPTIPFLSTSLPFDKILDNILYLGELATNSILHQITTSFSR